ncbi:hypothetical protein VN24_09090 [Paenibacillus beijingensis]|uniref:AB hydrolase-1 domain-containing protein n=2 Tax=Paenibacillus beijingensis TaxID=1126833 RepID=A0A0D5NRW1_9BACL|nr:hypothetical protein VN24_09090 [Paenibacillus beijingensis]
MAQSRRIAAAGGISLARQVTLGGLKQSILIQAEKKGSPVMLVLHGGPGMPLPGVSSRGVDWLFNLNSAQLVKRFTLVFWDQRGTGKTYAPDTPPSSMNVEQFLSDAVELTDWLRAKFHTDKIYLAAASWGTILGLQLAHRHPEKYEAYIGIAQIVNWAQSDKLAYDWLLERAKEMNNRKALSELSAIGSPPYLDVKRWNLLRKWLFIMGGFIYKDGQTKHPGMPYLFSTLLKSPDYKLKDIVNSFAKGMKLSYGPQMLADFANYDALSDIARLDVPVCLFHGKHDRSVSGELLQQFYERLKAPKGKQLVWLDNSAHIFSPDDSRQVEKNMIEYIIGL